MQRHAFKRRNNPVLPGWEAPPHSGIAIWKSPVPPLLPAPPPAALAWECRSSAEFPRESPKELPFPHYIPSLCFPKKIELPVYPCISLLQIVLMALIVRMAKLILFPTAEGKREGGRREILGTPMERSSAVSNQGVSNNGLWTNFCDSVCSCFGGSAEHLYQLTEKLDEH